MQDLEVTLGCSVVNGKDLRCAPGELFGKGWIEHAADREGNFLPIASQYGPVFSVEVADEWLEIFHVRTENKRLVGENGFCRILSAGG